MNKLRYQNKKVHKAIHNGFWKCVQLMHSQLVRHCTTTVCGRASTNVHNHWKRVTCLNCLKKKPK